VALVCAVSAAHRRQAFTVCSELVDRIKSGVPIWKEQVFSDGSVEWVGADGPKNFLQNVTDKSSADVEN
ncbi:MAG: molybdopterin biosynthesis MoaE protein, partial [Arthrobacter sp.]|nr:molybdopterin biosynthesis MoaE protein [Arthrobacter sp.]